MIHLRENMRALNDPDFSALLLRVGNWSVTCLPFIETLPFFGLAYWSSNWEVQLYFCTVSIQLVAYVMAQDFYAGHFHGLHICWNCIRCVLWTPIFPPSTSTKVIWRCIIGLYPHTESDRGPTKLTLLPSTSLTDKLYPSPESTCQNLSSHMVRCTLHSPKDQNIGPKFTPHTSEFHIGIPHKESLRSKFPSLAHI